MTRDDLTGWRPAYMDSSQNPPQLAGLALGRLPHPIQEVISVLRAAGPAARVLIVGGAVRDALLGLPVKDFDFEVYNLSWGEALAALRRLAAKVDEVGASFGVMHVWLRGGLECDVSIPRRENKSGRGHRGFQAEMDPTMTAREASSRRDYTINSAAFDPVTREFFDIFGAERDCRARVLRATSDHFGEDPARVLRGFQLAARSDGGLVMTPETAALCRTLLPEADTSAIERVKGEWLKWALRGRCPSAGLMVLREAGWLATVPELEALAGCAQDGEYHPEGDVLTHTGLACDVAAGIAERDGLNGDERLALMLAVLLHDIGKPATTRLEYEHACRERGGKPARLLPGVVCRCGAVGAAGFGTARILSPGHAEYAVLGGQQCGRCGWQQLGKGLGLAAAVRYCPKCGGALRRVQSLVETFLSRIGLQAGREPTRLLWAVSELVWQHMAHINAGEGWPRQRRAHVQVLAERLHHTSILQWARVVESDHSARLPLPGGNPAEAWVEAARKYGCAAGPLPPLMSGRHLVALGMAPGTEIGDVLRGLRRAQVRAEVNSPEEAVEWLWQRGQAAHLVRGEDLVAAGLQPGPEFRHRLRRAFDAQVAGQVNNKEEALAIALGGVAGTPQDA
jgi:tRNA nucleotidyltransferase/poly(A) polymerase